MCCSSGCGGGGGSGAAAVLLPASAADAAGALLLDAYEWPAAAWLAAARSCSRTRAGAPSAAAGRRDRACAASMVMPISSAECEVVGWPDGSLPMGAFSPCLLTPSWSPGRAGSGNFSNLQLSGALPPCTQACLRTVGQRSAPALHQEPLHSPEPPYSRPRYLDRPGESPPRPLQPTHRGREPAGRRTRRHHPPLHSLLTSPARHSTSCSHGPGTAVCVRGCAPAAAVRAARAPPALHARPRERMRVFMFMPAATCSSSPLSVRRKTTQLCMPAGAGPGRALHLHSAAAPRRRARLPGPHRAGGCCTFELVLLARLRFSLPPYMCLCCWCAGDFPCSTRCPAQPDIARAGCLLYN